MRGLVPIFESFTGDYRNLIHYAKRERDGQWFKRVQDHTVFGYRWGAWRPVTTTPGTIHETHRKARLPL